MSENQYNAPAMEVIEFGKEDIVCVISKWAVFTPDGEQIGGGDIKDYDGSQDDW